MKIIKKAKLDFNVWKITFINIQITFSPKNYRKWAKNYFYENWNINNWNIKTLLHIIPFIYGVSNMIWSRYYDQTIPYIFGISIPGIQKIKEEISWETFGFIKSKNIDINTIKKIDFYNNFCFIQFKDTNENLFVGLILEKSDLESFGLNSYKIIFDKNKSSLLKTKKEPRKILSKIENLYYQLDELPLKLEEINNDSFSKEKELIFNYKKNNLLKKYQREKHKLLINKKKLINKISIPSKWLKVKTITNKIVKTNAVKRPIQTDLIPRLDFIEENQKNSFFIKKKILQEELNSLFFLKGIIPNYFIKYLGKIPAKNQNNNLRNTAINEIPVAEFKKDRKPINKRLIPFSFLEYSSLETLELVNYFLQLKQQKIYFPRKLSGYSYPDLSRKNVYTFNLNSLFELGINKDLLKISLPSNSLTAIKNDYLISSNLSDPLIITKRKDNFLENSLEENKILDKNKKNTLDWKNIILNETIKKETKTFEDFDDSDPDSWFLSFTNKDKTKAINFEEEIFLEFLKKNIKPQDFYNPNFLYKDYENKKLIYHYLPFSESFINEKTLNTIQFGDLYKRTPTFSTFLNNNVSSFQKTNFNFFESWEPISSNSWMIITQFSMGLFLLQLLKDLYKDYGKELVEYVLQFASSSGIDVEEIKEQYLYDDPGYRLIRKIKKSFKDIAGIDNILPQLGEVVWFLRNAGRSSKFKNSIPNGILLTGPPGTGKTLLVQAIAGEAQVPIIVESGSLLSDPQQKGRGAERLKKIFDQARQLAPCIIFIDEVDTLGEKRQNIIQTAMGGDELIESIYENNLITGQTDSFVSKNTGFIPKPLNLNEDINGEKDLEYQLFRGESDNKLNIGNGQFQQNLEAKKTRLNILTQFLVEMDGLKERHGVIVIGATNRPNVLDPALIRPGRFDKIINLELPGKQKRIEILRLYGKNLQTEKNISWEYLANRTRGFSAADLAAAMNESTIQSILNKTNHTIETIERGIDLVTSYNYDTTNSTEKKTSKDPFFVSRLAYYQAGKAVLQSNLQNHPPLVVLHLWPRQKNARHSSLYQNSFSKTTTRTALESQLIGLYAGKASEMITLFGNRLNTSLKRWHSDLGLEELLSATFLANLLVEKWYFYSTQVLIRKTNKILTNRNEKVFTDIEKLELSNFIDNELEDELEIEKIAKLSRTGRYQQRAFGPWWQIQVAKQTSEIESFFADWYRIYLPDPEETILNLEWIPPDEYYHSNDSLKKLSEKSNTSYNDLYKIERDYIFHGLILNAFNKAFSSLDKKREFLDYFADYLLRFEILRENTISIIVNNTENLKENQQNISNQNNLKIIENSWGPNSRRKKYRFLNTQTLGFIKTYSNYQSPFFKFSKEHKNSEKK